MNGIQRSLGIDSVLEEDSRCSRRSDSLCYLDHEDRSDPRVDRRISRRVSGLVSRAPDAVVVHVSWRAAGGSANSRRCPNPRGHPVRDVEAAVVAGDRRRHGSRHRSARQSPPETEGPTSCDSSCHRPPDVAVAMRLSPYCACFPIVRASRKDQGSLNPYLGAMRLLKIKARQYSVGDQ